jgi:hypothetical protein
METGAERGPRCGADEKGLHNVIKRIRTGLLAASMLASVAAVTSGGSAFAAPQLFPPGSNFESRAGYQVAATLVPNNVTCTNKVANTWTVDWVFTVHSFAPETVTHVTSASAGGLDLSVNTKSQPPNYPPTSYRDSVWAGTGTYTGANVTQTISYTNFIKTVLVPNGVFGEDTSIKLGVLSPCVENKLPNLLGASRFVPLTPERTFDSRDSAKVAPGQTISVPVLGLHGVPAVGVKAVVLNVTATQATDAGFVTVWPSGIDRPEASSLNLDRAGQTTPNMVTVPVGADGNISVYSSGGTHILVDVMGYYEGVSESVSAGRFIALPPGRVVDTRNTNDAPGPLGTLTAVIAGKNGVPTSGAAAVVLNVTALNAQNAGYATVYPAGQGRPESSNLNLGHAGETRANQVIVKLGAGGAISFYSDGGSGFLADVAGYFTDATAGLSRSGLFVPVPPKRAYDSRIGAKPGPGASFPVQVGGNGLPSGGVRAVALNVTAVAATSADFVTVWPEGSALPDASNLNIDVVGQTVPNHVTSLVGSQGEVSLFTHGGAHLLVDVFGWYMNGLNVYNPAA